MTSYFARHGVLSLETHDSSYAGLHPRHLDDRLNFYLNYLIEVVPYGVTVQHVPTDFFDSTCEEIHLLTPSGRIFMSGLVSRDSNHHRIEEVAASEAYTHWLNRDFARDRENWRFFTGLFHLRFFNSDLGNTWDMAHCYRPLNYTLFVAQFLQEEYDSLQNN